MRQPSALDRLVPEAPVPRDNGEPVFAEPWEATVFGLAVSLHEQGVIDSERFRRQLIAAIERAPGAPYYDSWSRALEATILEAGLLTVDQLDDRIGALRAG